MEKATATIVPFSTEKPIRSSDPWSRLTTGLHRESLFIGGVGSPNDPEFNKGELIKPLIRLALLMLVTFALVQATPAHIYKSFPPSHKVKALAVKEKTTVPPVAAVTAIQAETPAAAPEAAPASPVTDCGSDPLMAYIYTVESGCRTNAYNYLGCMGLGQACPGSKLPCSENDWNCQNDWFRNYAVQRYGSIYNAYVFRTNNNWW